MNASAIDHGAVYHKLSLRDRVVMLGLRIMLATQPKLSFGPAGRPAFDALMCQVPAAKGVRYEPADVGGIPGWWCRPESASADAAILYLHGGAYIVGTASAFRNFAGQIAARAGAPAFVPDYRLAPENPFPAAIDDAQAAYQGLEAMGIDNIALMGDSAGGGLALALLQIASKSVRSRAVCAVLLSPLTDLAVTGASIHNRAHADPLLTPDMAAEIVPLYLNGHDPRDPRASPLYGDFAGLPPVLVHVGEDEILLDDSRRCAENMEAAGSEVELHIWEGMIHVFPSIAFLRASRSALDHVGTYLRLTLEARDAPTP
jgi:acetyl esterase/lipase